MPVINLFKPGKPYTYKYPENILSINKAVLVKKISRGYRHKAQVCSACVCFLDSERELRKKWIGDGLGSLPKIELFCSVSKNLHLMYFPLGDNNKQVAESGAPDSRHDFLPTPLPGSQRCYIHDLTPASCQHVPRVIQSCLPRITGVLNYRIRKAEDCVCYGWDLSLSEYATF